MFQKLYFPALLFISIFILSFNQLYAQEEESEIFIISERVGEVIDKEEINKYNLFPGVKGLQSVVFIKLPDGSYVLKATYIDVTTGEEKVEITPITESIIKIYGSIIDKFEEIQLESKEKKVKKPPLSRERIGGEMLAGVGGGIIGALPLALIGKLVIDPDVAENYSGIYVGMFIGFTLGSSLGVYIVGDTENETGSFSATLLGSAVGLVGISAILYKTEELIHPFLLIGSSFLPPIGGAVGFNITRRYDTPPASETALINFRDGQTSFAFPKIYFRPNPLYKGDLIQTVDLVKVRF